MGKAWVGGERRGARCGYWLEHALADIDAATVGSGAFESAVGLHFGHLAKLLETAHGLAEVGVGVKLDGVPEMKSRGASACLCAAIDGEDPFEAVAAEDVEHLVGRRDARTCGLARARQLQLAVEDLGHLVGELDVVRPLLHALLIFTLGMVPSVGTLAPLVTVAFDLTAYCGLGYSYRLDDDGHRHLSLQHHGYCVPFLYKSNIPSMREISKSGHGITGAYGKPATLMEGG